MWNWDKLNTMSARYKILLIVFLSGCLCPWLRAEVAATNAMMDPSQDSLVPTNWIVAARKVLPSPLSITNLTFHDFTNLLGSENQRGNTNAGALLGEALLSVSRTPEQADSAIQLLRNAANGGCVQAMVKLGFVYEENIYVRKNYNEAFHWFNMAAEKNDPEGLLELGGCYHYGLGTSPDFAKTIECYRRSAELTNYVAMKSLGYLLMNGLGGDTNVEQAKYWFTRAANEGNNRRAMYDLGVIYTRKFPDPDAMAIAFRWYTRAAYLGDPMACDELANFYYHGWGGAETNEASYRYWIFRAGLLGATDAQYMLGQFYQYGEGVTKDMQSALMWYGKAAAKNHPNAIYNLAVYYLSQKTNPAALDRGHSLMLRAAQLGSRVAEYHYALEAYPQQDADTCIQWMTTAANSGWPEADYFLYALYYSGTPATNGLPAFPADKDKGIYWLRAAARDGHIESQATLGRMLAQGIIIEKNPAEAEKWLRSAAEHGNVRAQNDLGYAILDGDVQTTDLVEAAMLCELAANQTNNLDYAKNAQVNLSRVDVKLSAEDQIKADQEAKNFHALPTPPLDPMTKGWASNPAYQPEDGQFGH